MAKFSKFIVAAAASLALGAAQADTVIDLFNGTQGPAGSTSSTVDGNMYYAAQYGPDNTVAGLYREIGVERTGGGNPGGSTSINVGAGSLFWSVGAGTEGRAVVRWDGAVNSGGNIINPASPTGNGVGAGLSGQLTSTVSNGLGIGLGAADFFQFNVDFSDLDFTFWLELYDVNGNSSKLRFEAQSHFNSTSTPIPVAAFIGLCAGGPFEFGDAGDVGVPFVDAANNDVIAGACSSGAFDIGHLGAIQFIMESNPGVAGSVDLGLSAVRVVPEPGALALVGLGLLGAAGAGFRRRRAA